MSEHNGGRRQRRSYDELLRDEPEEMSMLDQALEGASAEHKARVLLLLFRYNIEHDNEFYMLFVAFGHLTILVEEAPKNWRALFDDVHRELKQWSQENFKSLQSIQQHAKTSADLIAVLKQLLGSMQHSDTKSLRMLESLNGFSQQLLSIESSLASVQTSNQQLKKKSADQFDLLSGRLVSLEGFANRGSRIWSFSAGLGAVAVGLLLINSWTMARRLNQQQALAQEQGERIGWLLEKANRQECATGVKPAGDPQCRQFQ